MYKNIIFMLLLFGCKLGYAQGPIAHNDYITAYVGNSIHDITQNDTLPIGEYSIILEDFIYLDGVISNQHYVIVTNDYYVGYDSARYFLCNSDYSICDTAWIIVECINDNFFIPDVITPNGDNYNDTWVITGIQLFPDHLIVINDMFGNRIGEYRLYANDFDGTIGGKCLPDGYYQYLFYREENNYSRDDVYEGILTIKRQ